MFLATPIVIIIISLALFFFYLLTLAREARRMIPRLSHCRAAIVVPPVLS